MFVLGLWMRLDSTLVLGVLFVLTGACYGAEDEKNKRIDELTSIQLGGSSLKFEGDAPKSTTVPGDPPGMSNFRKESTTTPFLGLKFSTPLKDDFFKPGR